MNRRTFVKMAAATPLLSGVTPIEASPDQGRRRWPETVSLDNPIAHPYPLKFVEEVPLLLRGYTYGSSFEKEPELFRFMAHEWVSDAILFRGVEIQPKQPNPYVSNRELLGSKLSLYIDNYRISEPMDISIFMKEGGGAFPLRNQDSTAVLYSTFRGWVDKDGFPDPYHFLGYFLPNKECIVGKIEGCQGCGIAVEIKFDMARYTVPTVPRT